MRNYRLHLEENRTPAIFPSSNELNMTIRGIDVLQHRFTSGGQGRHSSSSSSSHAGLSPSPKNSADAESDKGMPNVHVQLMGRFAIYTNGTPAKFAVTSRAQSLITYVLINRLEPIHRAQIASQLWPESHDAQSRTNLRNLLYQLKSKFPELYQCLLVEGKRIQWRPDAPSTTDLEELEGLLNDAPSTPTIDRVMTLYRGDLMPSIDEAWLSEERTALRMRYCTFLTTSTEYLEDNRAYKEAILVAKALQSLDPLREETYRRLMRLHALNNDRSSALDAYRKCAKVLDEEFKSAPSKQTIRVKQSIQYGLTSSPQNQRPQIPALIGRVSEWNHLLAAWNKSEQGHLSVSLIQGEPGVGKSCLANTFLKWGEAQGIDVIQLRCYHPSEQMLYRNLVDLARSCPVEQLNDTWQQELAFLLPEFGSKSTRHIYGESPDKQRLMEAISRATMTKKRLIILVDKAEWCDAPTASWLNFHLRYAANCQHHIVLTARDGSLGSSHPLRGLLNNARQGNRFTQIRPTRLSPVESEALATSICRGSLSDRQISKLRELTEGLPLAIVELVKAGLHDDAAKGVPPLPQSLEGHYQELWDNLREPGRILSQLLAVSKNAIPWHSLIQASDLSEHRCLDALELLMSSGIVVEVGAESYKLSQRLFAYWIQENQLAIRLKLMEKRLCEITDSIEGVTQSIPPRINDFCSDDKSRNEIETLWTNHLLLP